MNIKKNINVYMIYVCHHIATQLLLPNSSEYGPGKHYCLFYKENQC